MKIYKDDNVFAKILRNEIPCKKVYEDDLVLCFHDINPEAKIHLLIIPKIKCVDFSDFISCATPLQVSLFFTTIKKIAEDILNLKESGYKLKTNNGKNAGQEVFHFHVHLTSN